MDDIVRQALAKWPDVPDVYGWLELTRRGAWLIKGERISNPRVAGFIGRNYERDAAGRWFFQNGPQRVFVALDYTPFVYRVRRTRDPAAPPCVETHTGRPVTRLDGVWIDETGSVLLAAEHGPGVIDDRDLDRLLPCFTNERDDPLAEDAIAAAIERLQAGDDAGLRFRCCGRTVSVSAMAARDVPASFGFVRRPVQPDGQEICS